MSFQPLHDYIIVRREDAETVSAGGIIIPGTVQEKPQIGTVVAVGIGLRNKDGSRKKINLTAGERVLFGKWTGEEMKIDGETVVLMREDEIMGKLVEVEIKA
jgi:chaperonin GroES